MTDKELETLLLHCTQLLSLANETERRGKNIKKVSTSESFSEEGDPIHKELDEINDMEDEIAAIGNFHEKENRVKGTDTVGLTEKKHLEERHDECLSLSLVEGWDALDSLISDINIEKSSMSDAGIDKKGAQYGFAEIEKQEQDARNHAKKSKEKLTELVKNEKILKQRAKKEIDRLIHFRNGKCKLNTLETVLKDDPFGSMVLSTYLYKEYFNFVLKELKRVSLARYLKKLNENHWKCTVTDHKPILGREEKKLHLDLKSWTFPLPYEYDMTKSVEANNAAICIQKFWRGYITRKKYKDAMKLVIQNTHSIFNEQTESLQDPASQDDIEGDFYAEMEDFFSSIPDLDVLHENIPMKPLSTSEVMELETKENSKSLNIPNNGWNISDPDVQRALKIRNRKKQKFKRNPQSRSFSSSSFRFHLND